MKTTRFSYSPTFKSISISPSHTANKFRNVRIDQKVSSMVPSRNHSSSIANVKATPWSQLKTNSVNNEISRKDSERVEIQIGKKKRAWIALGSNIGDRIEMIEQACEEMDQRGIRVKRTSSLWETEPMYVLDQGNFINGACEVETHLEPLQLLAELQGIEMSLGREKLIDKGPRNIDLDILLYEDEVISHPRLQIPHPLIAEREFVLQPLSELIPNCPLNPAKPWKLIQDYLNALPPSSSPISTVTPLSSSFPPLQSLLPTRSTHLMAILNTTPDSFSDGGKHTTHNTLSSKIHSLLTSPATIIDIGGQSSRPGAEPITSEDELSRILPALNLIRSNSTTSRMPIISIDTYRAPVAAVALEAGAHIINDISAGTLDPDILSVVASHNATIILTHMRGTPQTMTSSEHTSYPSGLIPTIATELLDRISAAEEAGIRRWRIMLDPGIGFAKNAAQNLEILRRFAELRDWPGLRGLPWCVGSSRKGFVGKITGVKEPEKRGWGSAVTVAAAVQGGADVVRVHDVEEMAEVGRMADAIWRV